MVAVVDRLERALVAGADEPDELLVAGEPEAASRASDGRRGAWVEGR
jgi:hypothetical protein